MKDLDDLKSRIKALMHEIEFTHLKKDWVEKLIALGIEEEDVGTWVAEIGHIVDEYERSLRFLVEMFQKDGDIETIVEDIEGWVAVARDNTMWKIDDVTQELQKNGQFEKYLSPTSEESDED